MKNYRILYVANSVRLIHVAEYYRRHNLQEFPYEIAFQKLCEKCLFVPGSWTSCMRELGNESFDVVPYFPLLQEHWAKENGVKYDSSSPKAGIDVFLAQIQKIKPDVIFFQTGAFHSIPLKLVGELKHRFQFLKYMAIYWGDWRGDYSIFKDLDFAFCCNSDYQDKMLAAGISAYENHSYFDHIIFDEIKRDQYKKIDDLIFIGNTGYLGPHHIERYENIKYLLENSKLKCWATEKNALDEIPSIPFSLKNETNKIVTEVLSKLDTKVLNVFKNATNFKGSSTKLSRLIDRVMEYKKGGQGYSPREGQWPKHYKALHRVFPDKCFAEFVDDYYGLLAGAKVVFNAHRDEPADYSNIRIFEATGAGSCLITDKPDKVKKYFTPDEEILTYTTIEECVEKVDYVLENDKERESIAQKGQARTLKQYTIMDHCKKIHAVIGEKI